MLFAYSVFRETSPRRHHLVEAGYAVAGREFPHVRTDAVHDSCNVVAAVGVVVGHEFRDLPVFRVASADNDFDDDLGGGGRGDGRVDDGDI